ncbi:MAG: hypothetical protein L0K47_13480 [Acidipropionibacterium jensenii]|uniref:hypothetical protein n=1 Tax=Acidipropionibacterium jensenii TaxID=1749 RepID=UPI002649622D|nr:hypothetical protein [Acidipropionibacterium jensenii]MDN5964261.1 hypothetical protein [Actinomyces sp.]MDN6619295.1 hypothetical protein [Corynebacterium variabile]MDN6514290.1 hypothetical protein [Acidipropionibacterium jensenii]MDN6566809.1 hypothetical protein [Actinomyces sp.]MDN6593498.1 hypothetical protein [Acidipropionibacterium jensenii]
MSERIDHAAEAREWIDAATRYPGAIGGAVLGVAEATLALVEQQRIANLIALAGINPRDDEGLDMLRAEASNMLAQWVPTSPDDEHPEIRPDIAAALGIGDSDE